MEIRGNLIPVKAKKRIDGIFEVGDELFVQSVLHSEPKLLVNAIAGGYDEDDKCYGMFACPKELIDEPIGSSIQHPHRDELRTVKMFEAIYAPVGSYSYSVIILSDGREVNDSILGYRTLAYTFDKIN
jgi:hypothetical protein